MTTPTPSRWLNVWAVLTVLLVFVQMFLGSVVTTYQWGMTDPVWPTAPWYLLQAGIDPVNFGKMVEHTHRAFGNILGLAVIGLAVWLWLKEPRPGLRGLGIASLVPMVAALLVGLVVVKEPWAWLTCLGLCVVTPLVWLPAAVAGQNPSRWLAWLGTAALSGVIIQGLFGGFRVCWHAGMGPELSVVHGVFAQVYFAALACLALLTARDCGASGLVSVVRSTTPVALRRVALAAVAAVFVQIVLGALLRHSLHSVWQRLHLISAFLVAFALMALIRQVYRHRAGDARGKRLAVALGVLLGVQILFGVEAWMMRFVGKAPELVDPSLGQAIVRTGHVLTGALIFALTAVTALWVRRPVITPSLPNSVCELEGVA